MAYSNNEKKAASLVYASRLLILILACSCGCGPDSNVPPKRFQATSFRTGNSLEGYRSAAKQGVKFVESDFRLTKDGVLVSTHDLKLGGDCGIVNEKTLEQLRPCRMSNNNHVASLSDFLALPFEGWFIDLKDTESRKESTQKNAIDSAIAQIEKFKLKDRVVMMVYQAPEASVKTINDKGMRAGIKGYPKTREQTLKMVETAFEKRFEMICVNRANITPEIIDLSAKKGVWHLAWDLEQNEKQWKELAKEGLGGVITRNHLAADKEVSKYYRRPVNWVSNKRNKD